jgi:hypothetical protein
MGIGITVGSVGAIDEASYTAYYVGSHTAARILVSAPRLYQRAIPLAALDPASASGPSTAQRLCGAWWSMAWIRRKQAVSRLCRMVAELDGRLGTTKQH